MAISIDFPSRVIFIPRSDLQVIQASPTEIRQLDLDSFRLELRDIEDSEDGMVYAVTHTHVAPITVGGVTLARIVEIVNDYTITFEDGQYAVNIVGGNSNVADRVNVNQVSVRSANSAGLTYSKQVEDQSFEGRVHIDTIGGGSSGSIFPRGTPGDPVDNLRDAEAIIQARNLPKRIDLTGLISIGTGESLDGYDVQGSSYAQSEVQLNSGSTASALILKSCSITNSISGVQSKFDDCLVVNISQLNGFTFRSKLAGTLAMSGDCDFVDCYGTAVFVCSSPDISVNIVDFSGNATIAGITDSDTSVSIGIISGVVVIDSSCVAGSITVADADFLQDNSGPGCSVTVINQHLVTQSGLAQIPGAIPQQPEFQSMFVRMLESWQRLQLDPSSPLTETPAGATVGPITISYTGDGQTSTTATRQP